MAANLIKKLFFLIFKQVALIGVVFFSVSVACSEIAKNNNVIGEFIQNYKQDIWRLELTGSKDEIHYLKVFSNPERSGKNTCSADISVYEVNSMSGVTRMITSYTGMAENPEGLSCDYWKSKLRFYQVIGDGFDSDIFEEVLNELQRDRERIASIIEVKRSVLDYMDVLELKDGRVNIEFFNVGCGLTLQVVLTSEGGKIKPYSDRDKFCHRK